SRSAGWVEADRRSSLTVTCGSVSTSCRMKSRCEPSIRPAIMMVNPTPIATPRIPTRVWRIRVVTWVQAISKRRFIGAGPPVDVRRTETNGRHRRVAGASSNPVACKFVGDRRLYRFGCGDVALSRVGIALARLGDASPVERGRSFRIERQRCTVVVDGVVGAAELQVHEAATVEGVAVA